MPGPGGPHGGGPGGGHGGFGGGPRGGRGGFGGGPRGGHGGFGGGPHGGFGAPPPPPRPPRMRGWRFRPYRYGGGCCGCMLPIITLAAVAVGILAILFF